ncbi:TIGR02757 family protein [Crocinitomix catalasitica]|uniref:TIGR02757 family protein n=1 Tax=Crocinitomix catalasitica TaxID=184607 RepID=UPI00047FF49F|nr:TIGR02757 family protein [Crocinitomix catalasitica]
MNKTELKDLLEHYTDKYNQSNFIKDDPISIPHLFTDPKDIESIGLIIATISWGNRKAILKSGNKLVDIMGHSPYDFIMNASQTNLKDLKFVHRTFNSNDLSFFILGLRSIYQNNSSLESAFLNGTTTKDRIANFRSQFLETPHELRTEKHVSNPLKGSASKRINMFLRWMARNDNKGVDFGIWSEIKPSELYIPLDVHTGNVARKLNLIKRKSNDWLALEELMDQLKKFDPIDPCKYDYALFGIGVNKEF